MDIIKNLESLLKKEQDNALIRYSLGNEYLRAKKFSEAIKHLHKAVEFDPDYSAAWKLYGKALAANNQINEAIKAYEKGITVAGKKGDIQATREMQVFLKRLKKQ
jgi:Tfp pilus assembly protein PilF